MIKPFHSLVLVPGVLMLVGMPVLAETVSVSIISALAPTACIPTLAGGGVVNYGTILASELSASAFTVLPIKNVGFSISCDAPAMVAIRTLNSRVGSLAGSAESPQGIGLNPVPLLGVASGYPVAGLGFDIDGTTKIGGYAVGTLAGSFTSNDGLVDIIGQRSTTVPTTWVGQNTSVSAGNSLYTSFNNQFKYESWATPGTLTPVAFMTLSGTIQVQAYLNRSTAFDFSHPIMLDGLGTIEIVYL